MDPYSRTHDIKMRNFLIIPFIRILNLTSGIDFDIYESSN